AREAIPRRRSGAHPGSERLPHGDLAGAPGSEGRAVLPDREQARRDRRLRHGGPGPARQAVGATPEAWPRPTGATAALSLRQILQAGGRSGDVAFRPVNGKFQRQTASRAVAARALTHEVGRDSVAVVPWDRAEED